MVQTIGQLLANTSNPLAVHVRDPVLHAVQAMNEDSAGSVLVLDHDDQLLGIFTERDVLTRVVECRCDVHKTPVGDVMTPTPVTADADTPLDEALELMRMHRVSHLPVVSRDVVIGVIALRDLTEAMSRGLLYENRNLHGYIHGPTVRAPESYF